MLVQTPARTDPSACTLKHTGARFSSSSIVLIALVHGCVLWFWVGPVSCVPPLDMCMRPSICLALPPSQKHLLRHPVLRSSSTTTMKHCLACVPKGCPLALCSLIEQPCYSSCLLGQQSTHQSTTRYIVYYYEHMSFHCACTSCSESGPSHVHEMDPRHVGSPSPLSHDCAWPDKSFSTV